MCADKGLEFCIFLKRIGGSRKRRDDKTDTHIKTLIMNFLHIDGSLHDQFDMQWCCDGHKLGSLDYVSCHRHERNTTHVSMDLPDNYSYIQTYDWEQSTKSWGTTCVSKRIFLKTDKFVVADDEIIVDYYGQTCYTVTYIPSIKNDRVTLSKTWSSRIESDTRL